MGASEAASFQLPTHPDAAVDERSVNLEEVELIEYDFQAAGEARDALTARFEDEVATAPADDPPPTTAWITYARCHDDIGWAISDEDAAAVGLDGHAHRRFLSDFYAGDFPGSWARGLVFQENEATGDVQKIGKALMLPVAVLPAAGILLGVIGGNGIAIFFDIDQDHNAHASKDRTNLFKDEVFTPSEKVGERILERVEVGVGVDHRSRREARAPGLALTAAASAHPSSIIQSHYLVRTDSKTITTSSRLQAT